MKRLFVNVHRPCGAQPSAEFLVEDVPSGDEHIEIINLDDQDLRVLVSMVDLSSYALSRALGALYENAYSRGLRDARKKLIPS